MPLKSQSVIRARQFIRFVYSVFIFVSVSLQLLSCSEKADPAHPDASNQLISVQISILPDITNDLALEDVILRDSQFIPMKGNFIDSGFDPETLWLKVLIHNRSGERRVEDVILMHGRMNYVEFHERKAGRWRTIQGGYELEPVYDFIHVRPSYSVDVEGGQSQTVYIRLKGPYYKGWFLAVVNEKDSDRFLVVQTLVLLFLTFVVSILLVSTVYLFWLFRNATYLWYAGYLFSFWIVITLAPGVYVSHLRIIPPEWIERILLLIAFAGSFFRYSFIRSFLQLENLNRRADRIVQWLAYLAIILSFSAFLSPSLDRVMSLYLNTRLVSIWLIFGIIVYSGVRGHKLSRLIVIPAVFSVSFDSINIALYLKAIPPSLFSFGAIYLMLPLELIVFFVAQHMRLRNLLRYYHANREHVIVRKDVGGEVLAEDASMPAETEAVSGPQPELPEETKPTHKTYLKPDQIDQLIEKLITVMKDEKLYQVEDLRAPQVAVSIGIKPHHLTELLNRHLDTTFVLFLKKYRIEESMQMIRENPETNLIDIAFEAGFQSRSVFNRAFKEITGMTPNEFRSAVRSARS